MTRVVTSRFSTSARDAGSEKRAIPQTSLWGASILAIPKAMRPPGPVMRTFSPLSTDLIFDQLRPLRQTTKVPVTRKRELDSAILGAFDQLLEALDVRPVAEDRFVLVPNQAGFPDRIFGGQLLAQAVVGA